MQLTVRKSSVALVSLLVSLLACCSGSDPNYGVRGTASGVTASGLVLQLNGGAPLAVGFNGPFTFPERLGNGASYDVQVMSMPPDTTCTVSGGTGTVAGADVTDVVVTCSPTAVPIGGTVTGMDDLPTQTPELVLCLNGEETVTVTENGEYSFPTLVATGSPYEVTIESPPTSTDCTISNATGTAGMDPVTNVDVDCIGRWTVGVRTYGVTDTGLVLQLNGANDEQVSPGASTVFFDGTYVTGTPYEITVLSEPVGLDCRVEDGEGVIDGLVTAEVFCVREVAGIVGMDFTMPSVYQNLDERTGATSPVSTNLAFAEIASLAIDDEADVMYGVDLDTDSLIRLNVADGTSEVVGSMGAVGVSEVNGLAFDAEGATLYGISAAASATTCQLVTLDLNTGVATPVGGTAATGAPCLGLAFDSDAGLLYASTEAGMLVSIDPATGGAIESVPLEGGLVVAGLGYDPVDGVLLGSEGEASLVGIEPSTGSVSPRGPIEGFSAVRGLTYSAAGADLFGCDVAQPAASTLLALDPCTGDARTIGTTGWCIAGMGRNHNERRTWGITAAGQLVDVDPNTGETTFIGQVEHPSGWETRSLVYNKFRTSLFSVAVNPMDGAPDDRVEIDLEGGVINISSVNFTDGHFEALMARDTFDDSIMYGVLDPGPGMDCVMMDFPVTVTPLPLYTLTGLEEVRSIAFDQDSTIEIPGSFAYVVDNATGTLVRVSIISGNQLEIGPTTDTQSLGWIAD